MSKPLTWDELATIYNKETGGKARILPMEAIAGWAEARTDLFEVDADDSICLKEVA